MKRGKTKFLPNSTVSLKFSASYLEICVIGCKNNYESVTSKECRIATFISVNFLFR
jgi:hypothetical protein